MDLSEGGEPSKTPSSASEARGDELVDPSTIDGDKWVAHKKKRTWYSQFFRRGVCDGNVLSPSLPVCAYHNNNLLKEVGSKAPSNLLHHLHSNTNHNKSTCSAGRSCAEAADCPTYCRVRYSSNAACYLLLFLPRGHVSLTQLSVPACVCSGLKNIVRSSAIHYNLRPATDAV